MTGSRFIKSNAEESAAAMSRHRIPGIGRIGLLAERIVTHSAPDLIRFYEPKRTQVGNTSIFIRRVRRVKRSPRADDAGGQAAYREAGAGTVRSLDRKKRFFGVSRAPLAKTTVNTRE